MQEKTEKEIIKSIKDGEIDKFKYLVDKYSRVVYYYVLVRVNRNSQDAEDIVQNAFVKIYKAIDRFDPERPFYPYFFTIVKNEIREFLRKNKIHLALQEDIVSEEKDVDFGFDDLIRNLKPDYQKVLKLYFEEGYPYKDIASKLGKPINTIKTLIRRAKEELREKLKDDK